MTVLGSSATMSRTTFSRFDRRTSQATRATRTTTLAMIQTDRFIATLYPPAFDGRPRLPLGFPPFDRLALVDRLLALGQCDGQLDASVLEVHTERHDGQSALGGLAQQLVQLL